MFQEKAKFTAVFPEIENAHGTLLASSFLERKSAGVVLMQDTER